MSLRIFYKDQERYILPFLLYPIVFILVLFCYQRVDAKSCEKDLIYATNAYRNVVIGHNKLKKLLPLIHYNKTLPEEIYNDLAHAIFELKQERNRINSISFTYFFVSYYLLKKLNNKLKKLLCNDINKKQKNIILYIQKTLVHVLSQIKAYQSCLYTRGFQCIVLVSSFVMVSCILSSISTLYNKANYQSYTQQKMYQSAVTGIEALHKNIRKDFETIRKNNRENGIA